MVMGEALLRACRAGLTGAYYQCCPVPPNKPARLQLTKALIRTAEQRYVAAVLTQRRFTRLLASMAARRAQAAATARRLADAKELERSGDSRGACKA